MKERTKKTVNGFSIRSDRILNVQLASIKEQCGASSIKDLLKVILRCPELPSFLFDFFRETSFEISEASKREYERQTKAIPSGTYKMKIITMPKRGKVVIENE